MNNLKYKDYSITEIATNHSISDTTVLRIFDSRVSFKHGIPTECMCIDEKCFQHGNTKFMLVILDFKTKTLIDILPDRKKLTLMEWLRFIRDNYIIPPEDKALDTSSANNRGNERCIPLKCFCIDMNQYYYDAISAIFPYVPIAIDSFHVIQNINRELNQLRIKIMKSYHDSNLCYNKITGEILDEETSDARQCTEYRALKKYWKLFLITKPAYQCSPEEKHYNHILGKYADPHDILDYCLNINPTLKRAWELKEQYCYFNSHATYENAEENLDTIIKNFLTSEITSFIKLAEMLIHWKTGIINSFLRFDDRRISNGVMEGMNSKIQKLITNAHGYQQFDRLRNRLLLRFGNKHSFKINK